ncbi:unnamed protein product [Plutella xylostella]|uniref:(diamondback moth) hypothetical protein n=1 Tax=Plutella xylostella TaxID=51655 RepID=A0A8S4G1Y7_PLUXY|nr:unnamed protein product [Plutella xylostella]
MEALVFDLKTKVLKHEKKHPMPEIVKDDDVIVKVAYSGVCGTDLHIMAGEFPARSDRPFTLGHEFSGVVHAVGPASAFRAGQKVVVDPNRPCNLCNHCRRSKYQFCSARANIGVWVDGGWAGSVQLIILIISSILKLSSTTIIAPASVQSSSPCNLCNHCRRSKYQFCSARANIGVWVDGGWAQYCVVSSLHVFLLPDGVSLAQGGLCEPYSCVSHGFDIISPITVGQKILICGAGIIGNLWITTLHHQGHRNITVSEMNTKRLEIVKNLQTGYRLVTPDVLEKEKNEVLYDVIIDCTGVGKVMEISFEYLNYGGKYVVFGCCPPTHQANINVFKIYEKELTIHGVKVNPFSFPNAIGWLSAMGDRYLNFEKLGVKVYALSDYQAAFNDLKAGVISKAMLKID